jgi:hypothetical protein
MNSDDHIPVIKRKSVSIPKCKNRNIRRLIGNLGSSIRKMHTGYAQTVSVYSSYITDPILWLWIGTQKSYDVVHDITLSILMIRPRITGPGTQITYAERSSLPVESYNNYGESYNNSVESYNNYGESYNNSVESYNNPYNNSGESYNNSSNPYDELYPE